MKVDTYNIQTSPRVLSEKSTTSQAIQSFSVKSQSLQIALTGGAGSFSSATTGGAGSHSSATTGGVLVGSPSSVISILFKCGVNNDDVVNQVMELG